MNAPLHRIRSLLVSLELTVVLLALSIVLVLTATLDQVNLGVWAVQEKYFRTFIVWREIGDAAVPVFPGGYTIGGMLFLNLVAAHIYRFRFTWRKSGILLAHAGVMLLLVGELLSGLWQETYDMRLTEGRPVSYSENQILHELAIIDVTDPDHDNVVAIPESVLAEGGDVQTPDLPFRVVTRGYHVNSTLIGIPSGLPSGGSPATTGDGLEIRAIPVAPTTRDNERNLPSAYVELVSDRGSLGTWLVSPGLAARQSFSHGGREWTIALRVARRYHPFTLTLLEARHDVYPGTEIPKNFSSRLKLDTPDGRDDREVLVYMNNPLRHAGLTFYQYQMNAANASSVLQVVSNPSWLLPYAACTLMGAGLLIQFGMHFAGFSRARRPAAAGAPAPASKPSPAAGTPAALP